jgi:5-methylcytosine-specific restriction protein A
LQQLRKQPLCERCLKEGKIVPATVAHHIKPHKGNEQLFFDPDNLASSCKPCHDGIEQSIERLGYEKGCDVEGRPLDPCHPWVG